MTWIVPWDGKEYDVDPTEFTGLELSAIKQRTGFSFQQLTQEIAGMDGDALRVLFWTVDRRINPDIIFSDYAGPPIRAVLSHFEGYTAVLDDLGKALKIPETAGSDSSASSTDSDLPSIEL